MSAPFQLQLQPPQLPLQLPPLPQLVAPGAGQIAAPKLSEFIKPFADVERSLRESIEQSTGAALPPMPAESLYGVLSSFEAGFLGGSGDDGEGGDGGNAVVETSVVEIQAGEARVDSLRANVSDEQQAGSAPGADYNEIRASPVLRIS